MFVVCLPPLKRRLLQRAVVLLLSVLGKVLDKVWGFTSVSSPTHSHLHGTCVRDVRILGSCSKLKNVRHEGCPEKPLCAQLGTCLCGCELQSSARCTFTRTTPLSDSRSPGFSTSELCAALDLGQPFRNTLKRLLEDGV